MTTSNTLTPEDPGHVTFVIPAHNRERFIVECLESIRAQQDGDWSAVVVDDVSADKTQEVVTGLGIESLLYVRNERRLGAAQSRNRGIEVARGETIVFIDSDDRLAPNHLSRIREVLRAHPEVDIVCCDSRIIDDSGRTLHEGKSFQTLEAARKGYAIREGLRGFQDVFVFSTTFPGTTVRKRVFADIGGFDTGSFPMEDVDLQLRATAAGAKVYYLNEVLCDYRTHAGSASAGPGRAVLTCTKKVECLARWLDRAPGAVPSDPLRRRLADARLELAIALWSDSRRNAALRELVRAAWTDYRVLWAFLGQRWRRLSAARVELP